MAATRLGLACMSNQAVPAVPVQAGLLLAGKVSGPAGEECVLKSEHVQVNKAAGLYAQAVLPVGMLLHPLPEDRLDMTHEDPL